MNKCNFKRNKIETHRFIFFSVDFFPHMKLFNFKKGVLEQIFICRQNISWDGLGTGNMNFYWNKTLN